MIHPFVATIPTGLAWLPSEREVEHVLELPIGGRSTSRTGERPRSNAAASTFQTDAYVLDDHVIWGATARIIELLLERLEMGTPGALRLAAKPHPAP